MSLIRYLSRIHFADRVVEDAMPEELARGRARRPILVVDADGATGDALERVCDALPPGTRPLVARLALPRDRPPPGIDDALLRDGDAIVALGGEQAIVAARRAARRRHCGVLIAAPTTAACIGVEPDAAGAPPDAILCDPTLALGGSRERAAETGFDALTHCLEAYLAEAWNPPADGIALEGARRAMLGLERAVRDRSDIAARREVMAAALNAALAAQKGHGALEAAARALEAETGLADRHGRLHGAIVIWLLNFNAPASAKRYRALADAVGAPVDVELGSALSRMAERLGLPPALDGLALGRAARRRAAARAAAHPASRTNPRRVTEQDYLAFFDAAL
jgi:alcohol dehydrogenase class IV